MGTASRLEVIADPSIFTPVFAGRFAYEKIVCAGHFREQEEAKHEMTNAALKPSAMPEHSTV